MWPVLKAVTRAFDVLLAPFARMHPGVGLLVVSVVAGVVMLFIFGRTSNQTKIAETKNKLWAYIMEMWLFRNSPRVMFGAIGSVAKTNVQYLRHSLRPIVFIIVPVLIIMVQLGIRYANVPYRPGGTAVVTVELADGVVASESGVELSVPDGVTELAPPLRVDAEGEISWLLRMERCGTRTLTFATPGGDVTKSIAASEETGTVRLSAMRPRAGTWDALLYPAEPPLPRDSVIARVTLDYPQRDDLLFGLNVHWLIIFFVVSLVAGFALKGVFGIEV